MADTQLIVDDNSLNLDITDTQLDVEENSLLLTDSLAVGKEFPNVETCRRTLKDIAITLHFDLRIIKSDRSRFIAKCSKEGCPWRVHVAKRSNSPTFTIRTLNPVHTCGGAHKLHHQQASVGWVARSVESRIKENPQYKPKEILQDIHHQHGVSLSYMQAWRGKERTMASIHGTHEDGYRLLPSYCEQIMRTNPGSIAVVGTTSENCFKHLFVSYHASIYGFIHGCRPLLELDKAHLKGKYLGTLLCACGIDANDGLFPLAIGVVDVESDENWMWFVSELRKLIGAHTDNMPRLTVLSERQTGVVEAVETHFPGAFHGFCLRFISENFRDYFKNSKLVNIFWNAVHALTMAEFESKMAEMVEVSSDVMTWLHQYPPQLWAVSYFEGVRYGHLTLGITEVLYNWALECHELPIVQTMEYIRQHLVAWFNERRQLSLMWTSTLVPFTEKKLSESISDARCYQVLRANEVEFEIVSSERTNIVDISTRACSCRRWQLFGVPCAHGAAALMSCGQNVQLFAEQCFRVDSYRECYSQMIVDVPERGEWGNGGEVGPTTVWPPKTRRPPGRPKKKVLRVENLKRPKRIVHCGRCHMLGHSQKKCTLQL